MPITLVNDDGTLLSESAQLHAYNTAWEQASLPDGVASHALVVDLGDRNTRGHALSVAACPPRLSLTPEPKTKQKGLPA